MKRLRDWRLETAMGGGKFRPWHPGEHTVICVLSGIDQDSGEGIGPCCVFDATERSITCLVHSDSASGHERIVYDLVGPPSEGYEEALAFSGREPAIWEGALNKLGAALREARRQAEEELTAILQPVRPAKQ